MISQNRLVKISKYLSFILRHKPAEIGLQLAEGGWVSVAELLTACQKHSFPITLEELQEVVKNSDKKRFAFDKTGQLIRANQGHSVEVDLQLEPQIPPPILYHGTGAKAVPFIQQTGLQKMSRHHVHLSVDQQTAIAVGKRQGKPVIFSVDAAQMSNDGYPFYCTENGVWLVDEVPPQYLQEITTISL